MDIQSTTSKCGPINDVDFCTYLLLVNQVVITQKKIQWLHAKYQSTSSIKKKVDNFR